MSNTTATTPTSLIPTYQALLRSFNLYGTFIILCPGIVLNTISMLVFFFRKKFWRNSTMGFYYSIEALVNNLACCAGLVFVAPSGFNIQLQVASVEWCQAFHISGNVAIQYSCYYTILISLDRTMKIVFRQPIRFLMKYRNCCIVICVLWLVVFATSMVHLKRYLLITPMIRNGSIFLSRSCTSSSNVLMAAAFIGICSRIIPITCNVIMNVMIIRTLIKSRSRIRSSSSNGFSYKDLNFAYTLVAMNCIFVICTLPNTVLNIIQIYNFFANVSVEFSTQIVLLQSVCAWGSYLYTSSTFFINFIFNKIFRSELIGMITKQRLLSTAVFSVSQTVQNIQRGRVHSKE